MNLRLIVALFLLTFTTGSIAWSAPITVSIDEFSVSGSNKPEELKQNIQTLLMSRMASGKIATVGKMEGAEIKISGSYLLSGNMFSLDAVAANNSGAVITRAFTQGKSPDDLIPAVSTLAKTLTEGIVNALQATSTPPPQTAPLPNDVVVAPQKAAAPIHQQVVFKMDGALKGMAVGRTFPNGDRELFVIGNHTLRYYRQGAGLQLLSEIHYQTYDTLLAVDTANPAGDKGPEIYVTIMNGEKLVSQIWTVDGTSLKQKAGPLPYFFRAITSAGGIKKLYAQQISDKDDFSGPIGELAESGQGYQLTNPLKVPQPGNLYNFNMVKGAKSGLDYAVFDQSGYLKFFNAAGDEVWKSNEKYDGSETRFARTDAGNLQNGSDGFRQVYLDQRIIVKANGEVLVPKNLESWYYPGKHFYSSSSVYCFTWDGVNLEEKWHTGEADNYLADFAYDDATHELLQLEVVNRGEIIFSKPASRLVVRKME